MDQKGKVGPLLKRLVPAPLHDLIAANITTSEFVLKIVGVVMGSRALSETTMTRLW